MNEKAAAIKIDTTVRNVICAVLLVLCMIWVNTLLHLISFHENYGFFSFIKTTLTAVFCTGLFYGLSSAVFMEPIRDTAKLCAAGTAVSAVLMLLALLLELGMDNFSIYGEKELELMFFDIPKKYFYDFWTIVWFPYNISVIFMALRREWFKPMSVLYSGIAVMGMTLGGILLFRPLSNIYQIDAVLMNCITLGAAVWKYGLSEKIVHKGKAAAAVLLYGIMRILLLPLQCSDWGVNPAAFMLGDRYADYVEGIRVITSNASFLGTSGYLRNSAFAHEYLVDLNKPVLQMLYYGGWSSAIFLILLMAAFVWMVMKLLGGKNGRKHKGWLIFASAAAMLCIRVFFGLAYGFGFPYPVNLPFMSNNGSLMDGMVFTLLIICALENYRIQQAEHMKETFVRAEEILGKQDSYRVLDEDGESYECDLWDLADISAEDGHSVHCRTEWYEIDDREFCVFTIKNFLSDRKRFILEYAEQKWILPDDPKGNIQEEIMEEHKSCYSPYCMEEEVTYSDDDEDFEDFD
ncbi:MAG: hypothetical protein Q4F28_10775 [Eubacteriales bacterium]|nr:hypothetical protein [Eubacteriales bacterium]